MRGTPSSARGATVLLMLAAAMFGPAVILLQDRWFDNLEDEPAEARHEEAVSTGEAFMAVEGSAALGESDPLPAASSDQVLVALERLKRELDASEADREELSRLVLQYETELEQLRAELDQSIQPSPEPGRDFRTVTRTRMRAAPNTEAEEVAVIVEGANLQVIDTVEDGTWHAVHLVGYAFHRLLEPSQER